MGTSSGFEVDLNFTAVGGGGWDEWEGGGGGGEELPHTDVHKLLSKEHQHLLLTKTRCPSLRTHILWFSKDTVHLEETRPSASTGTSSPARCHWLHWSQS